MTAYNKIVPGGWSIAAEAMFYLTFPLLLASLRKPRGFLVLLAVLYVVAGATYFGLRHILTENPALVQGFAFSFWLCQLPAFATGCWLALGMWHEHISRRNAQLIAGATVLAIVADSQLRGHTNLLISIALFSLLVWAIGRVRPAFLDGWLMPRIGKVSFSLYILHFAIVSALSLLVPDVVQHIGPLPTFVLLYATTLLLAGALAALTYRFIEQPFIRLGRGLFRRASDNGGGPTGPA